MRSAGIIRARIGGTYVEAYFYFLWYLFSLAVAVFLLDFYTITRISIYFIRPSRTSYTAYKYYISCPCVFMLIIIYLLANIRKDILRVIKRIPAGRADIIRVTYLAFITKRHPSTGTAGVSAYVYMKQRRFPQAYAYCRKKKFKYGYWKGIK